MRLCRVLFVCLALCLACALVPVQAGRSRSRSSRAAEAEERQMEQELDSMEMALMEEHAESAPDASSVLAQAQSYAKKTLGNAVSKSQQILAAAAAAGKEDALKAGAEKAKSLKTRAAEDALKMKAEAKAEAEAKKVAAAKAKAEAQAKVAAAAAAYAAAKKKAADARAKLNSPFRGIGLKADDDGVFGGVKLGMAKALSVPSAKQPKSARELGKSALNKFGKFDSKKNIYGRKKNCLKDIAAHFDEKDIYEQKKLSLVEQMTHTKSIATARTLRHKLRNLETWHNMMQKQFLFSKAEAKQHEKQLQKLFDAHLPQRLKDELKANKLSKRAGKPKPYPGARDKAMKFLRGMRNQIRKAQNMKKHGHKVFIRPELNDKGFPSMDPISSHLRGQLWRRIKTEKKWSTDAKDLEAGDLVVKKAYLQHGDFVEGPIAAPLLKGKLYEPETEKLGVPDFLHTFPWPKTEPKEVTMDDKMPVYQTEFSTYKP